MIPDRTVPEVTIRKMGKPPFYRVYLDRLQYLIQFLFQKAMFLLRELHMEPRVLTMQLSGKTVLQLNYQVMEIVRLLLAYLFWKMIYMLQVMNFSIPLRAEQPFEKMVCQQYYPILPGSPPLFF